MARVNQSEYDLLEAVYNNLQASKKAYADYLHNGKIFRYAQELKKYNSRIMELLSSQKSLLSPSLQQDAAALLIHYNVWSKKWSKLAAEMNPQPDDVFVFANDIIFPLQAAKNLEAVYEDITSISRLP